jgi:hypothetical protein
MHDQIAQAYQIYGMAAGVRDQLLGQLSDADLAYRVHGNPTLGELFAEYAAVQRSYIESFGTRLHDWTGIREEPDLAASIGGLKERFADLDRQLESALEALGDGDGGNPLIDRGGWELSAGAQLHTLREAMIITMGKAVVYLRAMAHPIPELVIDWVG